MKESFRQKLPKGLVPIFLTLALAFSLAAGLRLFIPSNGGRFEIKRRTDTQWRYEKVRAARFSPSGDLIFTGEEYRIGPISIVHWNGRTLTLRSEAKTPSSFPDGRDGAR